MPTTRILPVPAAARFIAETLLNEMDQDNGNSWPSSPDGPNTYSQGPCPYPPELMTKLEKSIQIALACKWSPTLRELELIAAGEERSMKRVLAKIPAGQGAFIHEVMDFCFNYGWEPDSGMGTLGVPPPPPAILPPFKTSH